MSYFKDVGEFHKHMELPQTHELIAPHLLSDETFRYRVACLAEEMRELIEAHATNDLNQFADSLADLVWFALGTAQLAQIPFDEVWAEVRVSNITKRRWKPGDPIKPRNGTSLEVVKPATWQPPDIEGVMRERFKYIAGLGGEE
jgi:predicted HAD superfamily Cof-like phosphohydrolase